MAQSFALPSGFSATPPGASPAAAALPPGHFALPDGFSATPPQASSAQLPSPADTAIGELPLFGPIYTAGKGAIDALNRGGAPGPNERRGNLAPVIRDETTGAMRLAWPQLAVDAANAFTLPGDVASGKTPLDPRVPYSQQDPATLDRAASLATMAGGASPLDAGMAPSSARVLVNADGVRMPRLVAGDLARSNVNAAGVNQAIQGLGPGGVLADVSPVLQGRAAKLATLPERSQSIVSDTLQARQDAAGQRIAGAMGQIAGPEPLPSAVAAGIQARKDLIGPYYDRLFQGANQPVNTGPIVNNLSGNVSMMRGPAQQALAKVRQMFDLPAPIANASGQKVTTDPRTVFEIRNAIDGMLSTETNPKVVGALTAARQKIDAALATAVPGIKKIDAFWQEQERQTEGFDFGRAALRHGEAPIHPDDLAAEMQKTAMQSSAGPMAQPSKYPTMIRQGMLSKMYEIVGNNVNDRLSLRKIITGEGKWNYQKIEAAFGPERAQRLLDLFHNEATMAQTENLALGGSKTARMAAGGQGMEANPNSTGFLKSALNFDFGDAAMGVGNRLTGGAFAAAREARNAQIARALMSPATWRPLPQASIPMLPAAAVNAAAANGLIDWHRKLLLGLN